MTFTYRRVIRRFSVKAVALGAAALSALMLSHSYGAQNSGGRDELELWDEIAYIRFQAARGHDLQADIRKEGVFKPQASYDTVTPGDELDLAGDEKYWASEDYQTATKHWEKAANVFRRTGELDKARNAMENADAAWDAAKRTLREGIDIHKMAREYYKTANNLEKQTAALGKVARNFERLMEMKR